MLNQKWLTKTAATSILILSCFIAITQVVVGFHLSFGHRLPLKAVNNPQLNPESHLIRPVECRNANNHSEAGICMFSIDCMQNKGVPLSICKHKYFVGTCCRLPDYNNFVGIVYDLRDTETNHVLEAREVASPAPPTATNSSQAPTLESILDGDSPSRSTSAEATKEGANFNDRYRISSTSLFGPTTTTVAPSSASSSISSSSSSLQSTTKVAGESPRNADGSAVELIKPANHAGELHAVDSEMRFHSVIFNQQSSNKNRLQPSESAKITSQAEQQKHVYETIVKEPNLLDSEVLGTFNSVHSPPSVMSSKPPPPPPPQSLLPTTIVKSRVTLEPAIPSTGLVENTIQEMSLSTISVQPELLSKLQSTTSVAATTKVDSQVLETTLGEVALASRGTSSATATTTTSDQEFTLSTSEQSSPPPLPSASSEKPSEKPPVSEKGESPGQSTTTASTTQSSSSSGSVSDLVSYHHSGTQTTTPFTVSLSTALLPNISSHPYAPPTQQPPISALVSPHNQTKSSPQPQPAPTQTPASSTSHELANFSQLYSNQHSSPSVIVSSEQHVGSTRPHLSSLYAASKIVTGSSSNSNLIPGLSNLQSAILSHIPFKIASGLSSYLQAAMKPTGSKPLISSNTAPSLQYQQQQHQQQQLQVANSSKQPHPSSQPTSTTAASLSQPSSPMVMMAPSPGVRFPGDNELTAGSSVSFPAPTSSSSSSSTTATSTSYNNINDVVRESQRVCGRPQVQQHPSVSPLAEGANKRMARIVGGNQSSFGQWPWMVSLRQWRKGAFLHKCGAALLNENWAITAAHCVEDVKVPDLLLRLGEFDVSNQEEPFPFVERRVKAVKAHPLFNPKTFEYDLALLRFAEPIKYERNIIPVCVPSGNDSYIDRMATVIGWGRLYEDGPLPDVIQHVDVPIITNNECEKMYKNAGYIEEIPDMFICAGISKGGRDSCEGDSGGPLTMVDHDGRSYLVGIISWGIGCALPSQPGVYTRITAFSGWINELAGS